MLHLFQKHGLRLHRWACRHEVLFGLLAFLLLPRLPNLAEPYWYGDEAIYLTIGTALRHGEVLYRDIVDHKTPFIYFLAMVPGQFWFRILLIGWMLTTTTLFYRFALKLYSLPWAAVSTLAFILATSLPWFEGHIPNGELFVMGFVMVGLSFLSQTRAFQSFLQHAKHDSLSPLHRSQLKWWVGGCLFLAFGILTKVPALLDAAGVLSFLWFAILSSGRQGKRILHLKKSLLWLVQHGVLAAVLLLLPLTLSVVYFTARGAFSEYVQFGLLYNIYYSGNWSLPFSHPVLLFLFSLPGETLLLFAGFGLASAVAWFLPKERVATWLYFWSLSALFGSLLSNRPYPHYLLQVLFPLCLFTPMLFQRARSWVSRLLVVDKIATFAIVTVLLGFGLYETLPYYQRYTQLALGKITPAEYRHGFNRLVAQNEALVPLIQQGTSPSDPIFLWGTNPMLYAQAQRRPATRFTVAFHIHDLKVYAETLRELQHAQPKFIVVMKNESPLPGLQEELDTHYWLIESTPEMLLYRRTKLASLSLLQ